MVVGPWYAASIGLPLGEALIWSTCWTFIISWWRMKAVDGISGGYGGYGSCGGYGGFWSNHYG